MNNNTVAPTLALLGEHAGISIEQMEKALNGGMSIDGLLQLVGEHLLERGKSIIHIEDSAFAAVDHP